MKRLILNIILTFMPILLWSQDQIVEKRMLILVDSTCNYVLNSLSIIPSSITLKNHNGQILNDYRVENNTITLSNSFCKSNNKQWIEATFKTFDFNIEDPIISDKIAEIETYEKAIKVFDIRTGPDANKNNSDSEDLNYNGSFARGFSVGNSQNLILNSNFNLSLVGDIGSGMTIEAAISDDNIPIQPEGNTQLIQDFDRVYIKVKKDSTSLIAGDYSLYRPESYFINISKKLKGLSVTNTTMTANNSSLTTNGNFAISRGKFARQSIKITEGNHGPYPLTGNNNERFIIVLSGTEKVYLDGALLKRGLDYDYVIDYNRAEVTFTATRFIGRESRIIVEYEYRDQNYLRTLYSANLTYQTEKLKTNFSLYTEQDSKNALGDIMLDSLDFLKLQSIGDNLDEAFVSGVRVPIDTFSDVITYILVPNPDPLDPNAQILQYSTDDNQVLYQATFTEVGDSGSYSIDQENVINGRVYKYVGPNNGNYEPIIKLVPPEKKQMMSWNADYTIDNQSKVFTELSFSNTDLNRYSEINNNDNQGWAGILRLDRKFFLDSARTKYIYTSVDHERIDKNFSPLNPYRSAEFQRDWNINLMAPSDENITQTKIAYMGKDRLNWSYQFRQYNVKDEYKGNRSLAYAQYKIKKFQFVPEVDYLTSEDATRETQFLKPKLLISQEFFSKKPIRLVAKYQEEKNSIKSYTDPSNLAAESNQFRLYNFSLGQRVNSSFSYDLSFSDRTDYRPDGSTFAEAIKSQEYLVKSSYISKNHQLEFSIGARNSDVIRSDLASNTASKFTTISKINYNLNLFKGGIRGNLAFNSTSGQEPKLEYVYEKVEVGQGSYIYIGDPDSTLIQANFRYAPDLGTGDYIRINQYNNEYINTQNIELSQTLNFDLSKILSQKSNSKFHKLLSKFSTGHTARISKKTSNDEALLIDQIDLFTIDSSIVSYQSNINNFIILNKGNPKNDFKIGSRITQNLNTQISEKEERKLNELYFSGRVKVFKSYDILLNAALGKRSYSSQLYESRNYLIEFIRLGPSISIRPTTNFRVITGYEYEERGQTFNLMEQSKSHNINAEITFRQSNLSNLSLRVEFVDVKYIGEQNSIIEFEILEGLKDGRNLIWNTQYTRRLRQNIDLTLSYEGRKNGDSNAVHIGRAQVKATF